MHDSYLEAIEKYGDEALVSLDRINPDGDYTVDKRVTINHSLLYGYKNRQGWQFRFLTETEIADMNLTDRLSSEECND